MAFSIDIIDNDSGLTANYWKILKVDYHPNNGTTEIIVGGWVDQQTKEAFKRPVVFKRYRRTEQAENIINLYAWLRTNADIDGNVNFTGAVNVAE